MKMKKTDKNKHNNANRKNETYKQTKLNTTKTRNAKLAVMKKTNQQNGRNNGA